MKNDKCETEKYKPYVVKVSKELFVNIKSDLASVMRITDFPHFYMMPVFQEVESSVYEIFWFM